LAVEPERPFGVAQVHVWRLMERAVEFDHQARRVADEIHYVAAHRRLAANVQIAFAE
jgi:hypothetical protein